MLYRLPTSFISNPLGSILICGIIVSSGSIPSVCLKRGNSHELWSFYIIRETLLSFVKFVHKREGNWEHKKYLHNTLFHWKVVVLGFPHNGILLGSKCVKYQFPQADEWPRKACNEITCVNLHTVYIIVILLNTYHYDLCSLKKEEINLHAVLTLAKGKNLCINLLWMMGVPNHVWPRHQMWLLFPLS